MTDMKTCLKCGERKSRDEHFQYHRAGGYWFGTCKSCMNAYRRAQRQQEQQAEQAGIDKYRRRHTEQQGLEILKNQYWPVTPFQVQTALKGLEP